MGALIAFIIILFGIAIALVVYNINLRKKLQVLDNTNQKVTSLNVLQDFMNTIINNYDELKNIKYLKERLTIYYIIELLNNYKNTKDNEKLEIIKKKVMELK